LRSTYLLFDYLQVTMTKSQIRFNMVAFSPFIPRLKKYQFVFRRMVVNLLERHPEVAPE
jgi:hypothetical protein